MSDGLEQDIRDRLLASPQDLLADRDVMRALVATHEAETGDNVIDIRGRAMQALEARLNRLEATHESVIAAAYDNQSGVAIVHRAVLALMESDDMADLIGRLQSDIAPLLRIETLRLVVEGTGGPQWPEDTLITPEGAIDSIIQAGRRTPRGDDIVLRPALVLTRPLHGRTVGSEALLPLDLGAGMPRAILLMGSADASRFMPAHGTDLLRFFAQVFRMVLLDRLKR
ncbi:DUF484 family protein [Paracoccus indicus]|uniref:DUF484 family protein n=1 Tax=Paracoccus indicus TaxID=2079229 RepID=UPI000D3D440F|nr:DUF484 family protein [Paracoccus indicus]